MPVLIYCTQSQILGRTRSVAVMQKFTKICDETNKKVSGSFWPPKSPYSVYKVMLKVNHAAQDPEQNDSQFAHTKIFRCCTWTILQSFLQNEDIIYRCSTLCFSCVFVFLIKPTAHKKADKLVEEKKCSIT